jgi:hypothetical protein
MWRSCGLLARGSDLAPSIVTTVGEPLFGLQGLIHSLDIARYAYGGFQLADTRVAKTSGERKSLKAFCGAARTPHFPHSSALTAAANLRSEYIEHRKSDQDLAMIIEILRIEKVNHRADERPNIPSDQSLGDLEGSSP